MPVCRWVDSIWYKHEFVYISVSVENMPELKVMFLQAMYLRHKADLDKQVYLYWMFTVMWVPYCSVFVYMYISKSLSAP